MHGFLPRLHATAVAMLNDYSKNDKVGMYNSVFGEKLVWDESMGTFQHFRVEKQNLEYN